MFGFIKNLLRRAPESPAQSLDETVFEPPPIPDRPFDRAKFPKPPLRQNANQTAHAGQSGKSIEVSLQKIINGLPLELQPRLRQTDVGDLTLSIPLEKILAQLSRGSVKISFGELRQALPDLFTPENDRDRVLVPLPLEDILARLNPALITRRRVQRQVEVPAEISSPFDLENQGLIFSAGPSAPEPAPLPTPSRISTPTAPAPIPHAPATSIHLNRSNTTFVSKPAPPMAPPHAAPARPAFTPLPKPAPPLQTFAPAPTVAPAPAPLHTPPVPPPSPVFRAAPRPVPHLQAPEEVAPAPAPTPVPAPVQAFSQPKPGPEGDSIIVPLSALAESWPEAVRKEIVDLKLADGKLALPAHAIEQGLKQGRLAFSWKTLRTWIKPAVLPAISAFDGTVLELPLKVVAPIFLARQKEQAKDRQKIAVDEEIPNLFFGFPQAETPGAPSPAQATARPSDTNYYVWDDSADMVKVHESETKRGPSPGTKFVAKYATPNEVVSRAAALDGVAGALIALPDGLMVASRLAPDLNGDTLAAFLPQIFGKVSQCTKELRMGELNNLNFTVGNLPWKIFRVNAIFFAAFGRAGEPLPTAQLAALAAELDHKPK